jgi:hypothetical protein
MYLLVSFGSIGGNFRCDPYSSYAGFVVVVTVLG